MATEMQEFRYLISHMLSPENDARNEAEKRYDQIPKATQGRLLFELFLDNSAEFEMRSMCLILLRRLLSKDWDEVWPIWGEENQKGFCEQLLKLATEETHSVLRKRLCDVIAEVARASIDNESGRQKWQGVLRFLEICTTSSSATLQETGMMLIEMGIVDYSTVIIGGLVKRFFLCENQAYFRNEPSVFGCDRNHYITGIKQMFQTSLLYESESSVRTAAVRAYVAFLTENEDDDRLIKSLSDQIPAVIKVCSHVVEAETDDDVPLQCLGDLASNVPRVIQPYIIDIFNLCCATVANKEKDDSYRHSALEVMVSVCESAPTMLDDDVTEWLSKDNTDEDDDDDQNYGFGESSLDRISCSLGGKAVLQPFLGIISRLIHDADNWKNRHAAIMGLSTVGEGCKRQMEPMIVDIVDNILPFINDPHPRVRYAVCNALGQMSSDFEPTLQKKCSDKIVDGLCSLLVDLSCPRVSAHAGAALVNFSEDCPKIVMAAHLRKIMEKLEFVLEHTFKQLEFLNVEFKLLERGKKLVLEQVITTIASVADAAEEYFITFYDRLMPPLKYILQDAKSDELKSLRGKTIECISLIGLAVGKNKFTKDAHEIMQILLSDQSQFQNLSCDDPQTSYMISAWARICKILGESFAEYLPVVMPSVLHTASIKPDVALMTEDEATVQEDDPGWSFVPLGDQKLFGVKTAGLEEKSTACEMLVCYARELKGAFNPYVESVVDLMLPHLKFLFSDEVRSAAAEIFPHLLACVRGRGEAYRSGLWRAVLPAYKEAIDSEHDRDVLADQIEGIAEVGFTIFILSENSPALIAICITELGGNMITNDDVRLIVDILLQQLKVIAENVHRRDTGEKEDEDDAGETDNEAIEEDANVLSRITDVVHALFKEFRQGFVPYFEQLEPIFRPWLSQKRHFSERQWTICMYDDLIEFGGEASVQYQQYFYEPLISCINDEYPEVRQAAAYGIGLMGLYGGKAYAQLCAGALQPIANMISDQAARSTTDALLATENAISAVAKILKFNSSMIDVNAVIPTFVQWLPVWEDTEESPYTYDYFADLIESNNPLVLGENNSNLPRILSVMVEALDKCALDSDESDEIELKQRRETVKSRLINIIKFMQTNAEMFQAIVVSAALNEQQLSVLQQVLS
ncbi:unnamed protein product [Dracunculus medinensis]|uniref:Importin-5 n=1 Tax=Dracunculus medinensis TaxID=318479 RepID=A0A0N4UIL2_DRAME|nr:unnamed protein product [Dracunculus medinensis]